MTFANLFVVRPSACPECGAESVNGARCDACFERLEREEERRERAAVCADRLRGFLGTVPRDFHWAKFGAPELERRVRIPRALQQARALPSDTAVALFRGPSGVGKTSCAVARGRYSAERGKVVVFATARELCTARREARLGTIIPVVADARAAEVLVLDGLGEEDVDDPARHVLTEVIFGRHESGRPTLVTCGLEDDQLERRYHDALVRRLLEPGRSHQVVCGAWSAR